MSIAVSAVVKPSRLAMTLVGTICISSIAVGFAILAGQIGELQPWLRGALATLCALSGLSGFYSYLKSRKAHHIDISGIGQIRLGEDSALTATSFCKVSPNRENAGDVVSLTEDSTLWPCLLLLRLRTKRQSVKVIFVLPDSVDRSTFKALSVACRWIASQNNLAEISSEHDF
jgi:toxin CptA